MLDEIGEDKKWSEKVINEEVLEHVGEKWKFLNNDLLEETVGLDIS